MSQSVQVPTEGQRLSALHDAFDRGALRQAARMLNALEPAEIAHLLESMPPAERAAAWELVDGASGGEVLLYVTEEVREDLLRDMDSAEILEATRELTPTTSPIWWRTCPRASPARY